MIQSSPQSMSLNVELDRAGSAPLASLQWRWALLFLLIAVVPIWISLGDHPLYGRSDGRYAVVSMEMADGGDWLVPHWMGKPHLTKPPLTYWMEAAMLKTIGHGEWAVRAPGAMMGSLTLVLLFAAGRRFIGKHGGYLAVGLLSVTPLHVCVSRLPLTDSPMSFFWFGTLLFGAMAVREPHLRRWPLLLWSCVALGLITKGPLAWIPVGILVLWLALAKQWAKLKHLRLISGFLLSLLPLLAWVAIVVVQRPDAIELWRHEMLDRMTGDGAHREPIWYFVPIFFAGLFPMTALIPWPVTKQAWSKARSLIRQADETALWALAVIVPFIFFSLGVGKLATYLLPLGAPLALLVGGAIAPYMCASKERDAAVSFTKIHWTLFICAISMTTALAIGTLYLQEAIILWIIVPSALTTLACAYMARTWAGSIELRPRNIMIAWLCAVMVWIGAGELEDWFLETGSDSKLIAMVQSHTDLSKLQFATYGKDDNDFSFYARQPVPHLDSIDDLSQCINQRKLNLAIVTTLDAWQKLKSDHPDVAKQMTEIAVLPKNALSKHYRVVLLRQ